jgi:trehalose 6-phosphate synthase/phosphatase
LPNAEPSEPAVGAWFPFGRLIVVSNRLPFVVEGTGRSMRLRRTVGGLVSAVGSFLDSLRSSVSAAANVVWVGWPGPIRKGVSHALVRRKAAAEHGAVPVFLTPEEERGSYEGFSNRTLWPLFHMFPSYTSVNDAEWAYYRAVNERFCDAILALVQPGDAVWIHDYHLMLVPAMLRARAPEIASAFFLHIPFPPFEILRVLPDAWARQLVEGVLGADVVGLHTYDYSRHLLRSADRLLGVTNHRGVVDLAARQAAVDAFPIGVDFDRFDRASASEEVKSQIDRLGTALGDRRCILSIDRLDYTKGAHNRMLAFETFLERHPEWRRRVSLVAVVVPSRTGVDLYRRMKTQIEEIVGRVNGRFGDVDWTPILYQYRAHDFPSLAALYAKSDVALVTPLRDGMNLIAKEYLASRGDGTGVLVLSDTAGAARELGEALIVNPYHVEGIADAIAAALAMPDAEQRRRNETMRSRLRRYDVVRWGREQFARVGEVRTAVEELRARLLDGTERKRMLLAYHSARKRLLLLDYDGTLVSLVRDPASAGPGPALLALIDRLAADPANDVVIVSGRDWKTLDAWFEGRDVALVSEHGVRVREPGGSWHHTAAISTRGKRRVRDVMQVFADRLPGSFVEEKESSVAWHYRGADPVLGPARAHELTEVLRNLTASTDLQVLRGKRVVEVKPAGANKGTATLRWLSRHKDGFVLAAGDDQTDEELFAVLPPSAFSIRVGPGESRARHNIEGPEQFVALLSELASRNASGRRRPAKSVRLAAGRAGTRERLRRKVGVVARTTGAGDRISTSSSAGTRTRTSRRPNP